jgi:hypothetical protein
MAPVAFGAAVACDTGQKGPPPVRHWTDDLSVTITSDITPPRAAEHITYTVVVRDKKSGQPIETGEGRIFATSDPDRVNTWNGLAKGSQPGESTRHGSSIRPRVIGRSRWSSAATRPSDCSGWTGARK